MTSDQNIMPVLKLKSMAHELRVSLTMVTISKFLLRAILRMSCLWANSREGWASPALKRQCTTPESTEFYEFYWNKSRSYLLTAGLDELIEQCLARNPDGLWRCLYCEFSSVHKHHLKNHCEAKHISGGGVECLQCGAISKTRKALAMHMSRKHKNSS